SKSRGGKVRYQAVSTQGKKQYKNHRCPPSGSHVPGQRTDHSFPSGDRPGFRRQASYNRDSLHQQNRAPTADRSGFKQAPTQSNGLITMKISVFSTSGWARALRKPVQVGLQARFCVFLPTCFHSNLEQEVVEFCI